MTMRIEIDERWRVRAERSIVVPLPAATVWGQMRDFRRFLRADPLHHRIDVVRAAPGNSPRGAELRIHHRLLGIGPVRRGRVCAWREGSGFAVSDLSMRGNHVGFPHVCTYRVEAVGEGMARVVVGARGLWTARWMPRWVVRAWLRWVLTETAALVGAELRRVMRWRTVVRGAENR